MWDFAAIAGYAAGALAVTLVIYPLRRPGLAKGRRSSLWQHRQLGWAALGFALVHVALLLASQPLTARYLLPSATLSAYAVFTSGWQVTHDSVAAAAVAAARQQRSTRRLLRQR